MEWDMKPFTSKEPAPDQTHPDLGETGWLEVFVFNF